MPGYQDIRIQLTCQQYVSDTPRIDEGKKLIELPFHSAMEAKDVRCPLCHGRVQVHDHGTLRLKDMPLFPGYEQVLEMSFHRWKCRECGHEFNEGVPLKADGARVTDRAARWVATLLLHRLTIAGVSRITGIHWSTVKRLHGRLMGRTLESRRRELEESGYRPTLLAVDEFAVHKGHTYATSVMDLGSGEVLWVGPGRGMADFEKFFHDMDMRLLERVEAVAMDMNASYNRLVERHMPWAEVVYDRYHMQAQYGKDVMGQVRLDEARAHREKAEALLGEAAEEPERGGRRALKAEARREKALYRELKGSRWLMLKGRGGLCEAEKDALGSILEDHQALALCHAKIGRAHV